MQKLQKDFILKSVTIIIVILLHLFIFIYKSSRIDFGSYKSVNFESVLYPMNEYYKKFGNKKFKIILTKISSLNTDFINQVKDSSKNNNGSKSKSNVLLKNKKDKKIIVKKDINLIEKGLQEKTVLKKDSGKDNLKGAGLGGLSDNGKDKGDEFSAAAHIGGYLRNPKPPYPNISRQNNEQGSVVLEVVVEPSGYPSKVSIIKSSGYRRLDNSARITVEKKYKFIPAKRLGIPLRSSYRFTINFMLD